MPNKMDETRMFKFGDDNSKEIRDILNKVHTALSDKGYNPVSQLVGYFLSGDPAYITSHNNARALIRQFERDEFLDEIVNHYLSEQGYLVRTLGLDIGKVRIGVAISDATGFLARGLEVIKNRGNEHSVLRVANLCNVHDVKVIVIGLPRNMDGTEGPAVHKVREFGALLAEKMDLPIRFWDERLSTVAAQQVLIAADVSRKKRKQVVDKVAAVVILQNYLDSLTK